MIRHLSHGYLYDNAAAAFILKCVDAIFRLIFRKKRSFLNEIRKILVVKPAHMGDALSCAWGVVVTGMAEERGLAKAISNATGRMIADATGRFTIQELAALSSGSHMVFCPDSLSGHIAGLSGVPTVAYHKRYPSDSGMWRPLGSNVTVVRTPDEFIRATIEYDDGVKDGPR